jgi:hypothetical protein
MEVTVHMQLSSSIRRLFWTTTTLLIGLASVCTPVGSAEPTYEPAPSPYPDNAHVLRTYDSVEPDRFFIADQPGVWFLTPTGLDCGIFYKGGFGCAGDIPGAPAGTENIAWYNGDRMVHYGWPAAVQFPAGRAIQTLPPHSFVTYNETTCAATPDNGIYCSHGMMRFLINTTQTWLNG